MTVLIDWCGCEKYSLTNTLYNAGVCWARPSTPLTLTGLMTFLNLVKSNCLGEHHVRALTHKPIWSNSEHFCALRTQWHLPYNYRVNLLKRKGFCACARARVCVCVCGTLHITEDRKFREQIDNVSCSKRRGFSSEVLIWRGLSLAFSFNSWITGAKN